jgi:hypothetical protein
MNWKVQLSLKHSASCMHSKTGSQWLVLQSLWSVISMQSQTPAIHCRHSLPVASRATICCRDLELRISASARSSLTYWTTTVPILGVFYGCQDYETALGSEEDKSERNLVSVTYPLVAQACRTRLCSNLLPNCVGSDRSKTTNAEQPCWSVGETL